MNDSLQIVIRLAMKTLAGFLVARALATPEVAGQIADGVGAGLLILFGVIWSHLHVGKGKDPTALPKGPLMLLFALGLAAVVCAGCKTALNSDKIVAVKQRCFGLVLETTSTTANAPNVKLGFTSTVWQMIPTSTNTLYAPAYMDTFELDQGLNPFSTGIAENTGAGLVMLGTNGEASAFPPNHTAATKSYGKK